MKANIHPKYFEQAQVICACGNRFTTGSTLEVIHVELCNKCHPFYTGEQRFVDSANRIERFKRKQDIAKQYLTKKVKKQEEQKAKDNALRNSQVEIIDGADDFGSIFRWLARCTRAGCIKITRQVIGINDPVFHSFPRTAY
jgi:large subunit ribosomal protein L31